jgi:hypothetical protein
MEPMSLTSPQREKTTPSSRASTSASSVPVLASPPHQRDEMSMISLVFFFENEAY